MNYYSKHLHFTNDVHKNEWFDGFYIEILFHIWQSFVVWFCYLYNKWLKYSDIGYTNQCTVSLS